MKFLFRNCGPGLFAKSVSQGAATVAFCAVEPGVTPGSFYCDRQAQSVGGPDAQIELWERSELLLKRALSGGMEGAGPPGDPGLQARLLS